MLIHFLITYLQLPDIITRKINSKTIPAFCNILKSASWSNVIKEENPKLAFDNFFELINSARDISFPEVCTKSKPLKFTHSPWMTPGLKISQIQKEKLFANKLRNPSVSNTDKFKSYNKIYNKL